MPKVKPASKPFLVYVDDDEDDLLLVKGALSPYENVIELHLLQNGYEGYNFLLSLEKKQQKPCLIILDINMPLMSGKELLPILRSLPFFADVPIILFTTSSMEHDYRFALQYDAGFITKPMTVEQMHTIVEQFLSYCSAQVREIIKGNGTYNR
jgi:CheY-like chemotaxis protein